MALLSRSNVTLAGTPPTFAAASAGGDTARIGGFLIVKNDSGGSITATLVTPGNLATGDAFPDKAYSVTAGAEVWVPVLPEYRDSADGYAHITYSAVTSVTVAHVLV